MLQDDRHRQAEETCHVSADQGQLEAETAIHRADAEFALGLPPQFDPALAVDGVSEFLENLWRARAWKRDMGTLRGAGETVGLRATDLGERWTVVRTPSGFNWSHHPPGRPRASDVTASGQSGDLYLFVWKRLRPDSSELKIRGDTALLKHWLRYSSV